METILTTITEPVHQPAVAGAAHTKALFVLHLSFDQLHVPQTRMLLGRLLDGRLRIVEPFHVRVSSEEGQCVAEAPEVGEVGVGKTRSDALRDLQATLGELFLALERDQHRLGEDLAQTWQVMQRKIRTKVLPHQGPRI